jgi:hypothetical protein
MREYSTRSNGGHVSRRKRTSRRGHLPSLIKIENHDLLIAEFLINGCNAIFYLWIPLHEIKQHGAETPCETLMRNVSAILCKSEFETVFVMLPRRLHEKTMFRLVDLDGHVLAVGKKINARRIKRHGLVSEGKIGCGHFLDFLMNGFILSLLP